MNDVKETGELSRRQFLKDSGAAAAVTALGTSPGAL